MKAVSFKNSMTEGESFKVLVDRLPHFYDRLHFHPELQITLIIKGYGTLFIGDRVLPFRENDLIVIGPSVPHMWKNDPIFYEAPPIGMEAISIHFNRDTLGASFWALPELGRIHTFFHRASRGIAIHGALRTSLAELIQKMVRTEGFGRLILLMEVLHALAIDETDQEVLASIGFDVGETIEDQKLNRVFQYVIDHFQGPMTLEEVARVANLSTSAFCRYFKLRTRKTFVRFLNEIRIGAACRHLLEGKSNVTEIAYQVGFNNLSNFNRQFKKIKGYTPTTYVRSVKG
ncbi:MAG: AraC family transcriptional regulator [Bacteroidota bacterium]